MSDSDSDHDHDSDSDSGRDRDRDRDHDRDRERDRERDARMASARAAHAPRASCISTPACALFPTPSLISPLTQFRTFAIFTPKPRPQRLPVRRRAVRGLLALCPGHVSTVLGTCLSGPCVLAPCHSYACVVVTCLPYSCVLVTCLPYSCVLVTCLSSPYVVVTCLFSPCVVVSCHVNTLALCRCRAPICGLCRGHVFTPPLVSWSRAYPRGHVSISARVAVTWPSSPASRASARGLRPLLSPIPNLTHISPCP
jgi:hypothetical protein